MMMLMLMMAMLMVVLVTDDGTRKSEKFDASRTSYVIRELAAGAAYHVRLKSSSFVGQSPFTEFIDAAVLSPGNNNYYSVNVVATVFYLFLVFFSALSVFILICYLLKKLAYAQYTTMTMRMIMITGHILTVQSNFVQSRKQNVQSKMQKCAVYS